MKTAVLFLSHLVEDYCLQRYEKLVKESSEKYDVFWAYHADGGKGIARLQERGVNLFTFTAKELNQLGYTSIAETLVPGSVHFVMSWFYRQHPEYDFCWNIEYDVMFTGNWNTFFAAFAANDADLLASHIEFRSAQNEQWPWWKSLSLVEDTPDLPSECVKCFAPVYRLSKRAFTFIDSYFKKANSGHMEVLLSTALYRHGFSICDIGGTGEFTPLELRNRFYVQGTGVNNGTMRWRPVFCAEGVDALEAEDKLFHPVKRFSLLVQKRHNVGSKNHKV